MKTSKRKRGKAKRRGTRVFCPECQEFRPCIVVPLSKLGKPSVRRLAHEDQPDVAWFQRGRECLECGSLFVTAELHDEFIKAIVAELKRQLRSRKRSFGRVRKGSPLFREETVPYKQAYDLVWNSTWWLTHSSGQPVRAHGHADRVESSSLGWAVEFGANRFLHGLAIERSRKVLARVLDELVRGEIVTKRSVSSELMMAMSGAVANYEGEEYPGYYPIDGDNQLVFGSTAIDLDDPLEYILDLSGVTPWLLDE